MHDGTAWHRQGGGVSITQQIAEADLMVEWHFPTTPHLSVGVILSWNYFAFLINGPDFSVTFFHHHMIDCVLVCNVCVCI